MWKRIGRGVHKQGRARCKVFPKLPWGGGADQFRELAGEAQGKEEDVGLHLRDGRLRSGDRGMPRDGIDRKKVGSARFGWRTEYVNLKVHALVLEERDRIAEPLQAVCLGGIDRSGVDDRQGS